MTRLLFHLRLEEAVALAFLLPTTWLTVAANLYAREAGVLGARHPGGLVRLAAALVLGGLLLLLLRFRPRAAFTSGLRDVLPFLLCILVYTNLHDTIGFVNPNDVHHHLIAIDQALFGVGPTQWAEQFITPARTEWMYFFYASFFWLAPSVSVILLLRRRSAEFRASTLAVVTCFFLGYAFYVLFPAAPPRLVLAAEYTKNLHGYRIFSRLGAEAIALLPVDSRAAFPSLHTAASLVMLVCAWRHVRPWFWIALPFVLGLWASTIYLRHHYAVDLLAGWALAPVALYVSPRLDRWWADRQRELGITPARDAAG